MRVVCSLATALVLGGCATPRTAPTDTLRARAALEDGQRAAREGRADQAIESFRRALALQPHDWAAMRLLVEAQFGRGRIDEAVGELSNAVAARPDDDVAHYGLGLALYSRSAVAEERALAELARASALAPSVAEYHFRQGVIHLDAERWEKAASSLRLARDLEPGVARHHVPLALALGRLGDRAGAIEEIRAILALSPDPHDLKVARQVMAHLVDPFREFPKAIEGDFTRALDLMDKADSPQQAIVLLEEVVDRFPDLAAVHAALGLCYERLGDAAQAMEQFRQALDLAPEDPRNHLYVADVYFSKERFDRARESYQAAVKRDPLSDHAYERLGQLALQRGDAADAVGWLRSLVVLRPGELSSRLALGTALLTLGALDEAERELSAVVDKDAKNADALLKLGSVSLERKKQEPDPARAEKHAARAAACFEKVLDLQPQNAFAARLLQATRQP